MANQIIDNIYALTIVRLIILFMVFVHCMVHQVGINQYLCIIH